MAGGGGAGGWPNSATLISGGSGGGGSGASTNTLALSATAGAANTGSGGGSSGTHPATWTGGNGGSGVVVIRVLLCPPCTAGAYQSGVSATNCSACAAGTYQSGSSGTGCASCSKGQYSSSPAASACAVCGAGQYNTYAGATACVNMTCTSGSALASQSIISSAQATVQSAQVGTIPVLASNFQVTFTLNLTRNTSYTYYTSFFRITNPSAATGDCCTYADRIALWMMYPNTNVFNTLAGALTWQAVAGQLYSVSITMDQNNQVYGVNGVVYLASSYSIGSRGPQYGAAVWATDQYYNAYPSTIQNLVVATCQCLAGYNGTGDACSPCVAGTYASAPGSVNCTPCAAGGYSNASGASGCTPCQAGTCSTGVGLTASGCSACVAGSYSSGVRGLPCVIAG